MKIGNLPSVQARLKYHPVLRGSRESRQALHHLHRKYPGRGGMFVATEDYYVINCGFRSTSGEWCKGRIGEVRRYRPGSGHITTNLASFLRERSTRVPLQDGDWFVFNVAGLFDNRDGFYGVMKPKRVGPGESPRYINDPRYRQGRSRMPEDIRAFLEAGSRSVIGEYPRVPCGIYCPRCSRLNLVVIPDDVKDSPAPVDEAL